MEILGYVPRLISAHPFCYAYVQSTPPQGAPVNGWDESGWTALHYSAWAGWSDRLEPGDGGMTSCPVR